MEKLNKDQLDKMSLEDQIKYINNELMKDGSSLTGVCKAIGIGRTTVRERAKKQDFIFNKSCNQYVKNVKKYNIIQTATPSDTKIKEVNMKEISNKNNSDVVVNNVDVIPNNDNVVTAEYKEINGHKIDYILSKFDTLEEMIKIFEAKKESVKSGDQSIIIDLIDDRHLDPKPRSMRVNTFVLKEWDQFCNENRYYQKMDLVSMALKEYIENHRK